MAKTAGQLLAEMIKAREEGKDETELRKAFEEQSRKQLGPYAAEMKFTYGERESDER